MLKIKSALYIMKYKCEYCNKNFEDITDYTRHMNRKKKCYEKTEHKCAKCNKLFANKATLSRHILTIHKEDTKKNEEKKLKTKLDTISNEAIDNSIASNIIGDDNTINANIIKDNIFVINLYGKENTEYIKDTDMKKVIGKQYGALIELIKMKHFNKNHTENCNFHIINNANYKYTMVKKDNTGEADWEVEETEDFFQSLFLNTVDELEDYINNNNIEANTKATIKIQRMKEIIEEYDKDDKKNKTHDKYNEFYIDLLKLSIRYLDMILELKKQDQENIKSQKNKKEQETILKTEPTKRQRGRPRKT
jgi:hypothetical protein